MHMLETIKLLKVVLMDKLGLFVELSKLQLTY